MQPSHEETNQQICLLRARLSCAEVKGQLRDAVRLFIAQFQKSRSSLAGGMQREAYARTHTHVNWMKLTNLQTNQSIEPPTDGPTD